MLRPSICMLALGSIALASAFDPWHPEWGPPPPVAPFGNSNLPSQRVQIGLIFPVLGSPRWEDSYNQERGKFKHTGIDIKAPKMSPIVAPISGTLGMKPQTFWIYGDNGWIVLGTHLNDDNVGLHDHKGSRDVMFAPDMHPGQHVYAGQFIGYVGESGNATAPHLHFEIYAPGSGTTMTRIRDPFASLKLARVISAPIPAPDNPERRPEKGEVRLDGCIRRVNEASGTVTMLVTEVERSGGQTEVVTGLQYRQIKISQQQLKAAGGWAAMRALKPYETISAYVADSSQPPVRMARQLMLAVR